MATSMATEKYNLRSVFTGAELHGIKFLEKAVSNAEHRHTVRARLGKGNPGEAMLRHQKYGKILGVFGYDQLPLKPLTRIEKQGSERQIGVKGAMPETFSQKTKGNGDQNITTLLKRLIGEIEVVGWLDPDEREQLVNTFISDLAYRYNNIQNLMIATHTPQQNRALITKVFERIGAIKNAIMEKCRFKKAAMDKLAMFSPDANSCRVISLFRTELNKRINTTVILRDVTLELEKGLQVHDNIGHLRFDKLKHEIQEFKDALESVIHPIPHIDPPKLTQKSQNTINRRRLFIENSKVKYALHHRHTVKSLPVGHIAFASKTKEQVEAVNKDLALILGKGRFTEEDLDSDASDMEDGTLDALCELESQGNSCKLQDNPVLQAHTLSSNFRRRKDRPEMKLETPKRYLSEDHYTNETLRFDYDQMDSIEAEIAGEIIESNFPSFTGPNKMITRPMDSRVSLRIPKGFITLSAEPAAAVSEFGSEVDSKLINSLDEKLSRFKEVEELYEEIMKTVNGFHLETSDESAEHIGCPSAPYDAKIPLTHAYQGIVVPVFTPAHPKKASPIPEEDEEERDEDFRSRSPSIRLRTRDRNGITVTPDDFAKDRLTAMRKTPSSRYNVLKYNYGGYIPYDIDKKKKKKVEVFTPSDYIDYLRTRTCDFIMDLLVDREKDEEEMRKVLEEQEYLRSIEEEERRNEEARERHRNRLRKMTEFSNGMWNAGTLDYMEEIQQPRISQEENEFEPTNAASNGHKSPSQLPSNGHNMNNAEHVSSVSPKPSPLPPKKQQSMPLVGAGLDIHEAQNHLESLWIALKMPVDQKLDMAIKYGSAKFALKLQTAIELWETARNYITDRENLLKEIEQFEIVASDPQRFFKKGYDGSSEARLVESRHREEYLRKLHYFEARLHDVTSMIKYELNETVTYQGVPYLEKIKTDYADMIRKIQLKRAAEKIEIGVARSRSVSPRERSR